MDVGTRVAIDFLEDYAQFGSRGHLLTALALQAAIRGSNDEDVKRILSVKVYAEFIAALEDLAAICIAAREREEGVGLVYAYLKYGTRGRYSPNTTIREMFQQLKSKGHFLARLNLPTVQELQKSAPDLWSSPASQLIKELDKLLPMAANAYLHQEGAFVRAYNKTKHGFVVVKDQHTFQPEETKIVSETAWIVSDNPDYHPDNAPDLPVVELFSVELKNVDAMVERMQAVRGAVVSICLLISQLLERGLISSADNQA